MTTFSLADRPSYASVFRRAVLWLFFLVPFFYLTYGLANWYASTVPEVGSIVFSWERHVPFLAWSIVPYWSINLFYALSLFLNENNRDVDRLAGRYLTAQLIACVCFVAFPLTASFSRPETNGFPGFMFDVLTGFDKPFNQAPSLHIALLVIIWDHLRRRLPAVIRMMWHIWCLLIGVSVLTTFQHHFIDIPTGGLLGLFALWLFPDTGKPPPTNFTLTADPKRRRLGAYYAAGAALLLVGVWLGAFFAPEWLALLWPSLALGIVAFAYFGAGVHLFQKEVDGRVSIASRLLLWPYRVGARLNAWVWTRRQTPQVAIADGVHLGRYPRAIEAASFATIVDLAAEFERPFGVDTRWLSLPMLDLVRWSEVDRRHAVDLIEDCRLHGPVLVCCALGFQRSAGAIAEWLIETGRASDLAAAEDMLRKTGRPVHLARKPAESAA